MHLRTLLILPAVAALSACGGDKSSTSSSSVQGLSLPENLEVIPVDSGDTANSPGPNTGDSSTDSFPPTSDYFTDASRAHIWDRALEPLEQIGQILGMIGQTRADQFVNQGAYLALVDEGQEEVGQGDASPGSQGQSSASNATELNSWTVLATRKNAKKPQVARFWIPMVDEFEGEGGAGDGPAGDPTIFAQAEVREAASDTNPYGSFDLNYVMRESAELDSQSFERGILRSVDTVPGFKGFGHTSESELWGGSSRVEVRVSEDDSEGLGRIIVTEPDWETGGTDLETIEFHIAYDEDQFVRRTAGGTTEVFERGSYDTNTWMYGLYHASGSKAGQRVALEGGFPIQKDGFHGWADYWGIWTEPGFDLEDGDTITSLQDGDAEVSYTAVVAPGRLIRVQRQALALSEMDLVRFEYWSWDDQTFTQTLNIVEYRHDSGSGVGTFWSIATYSDEDGSWEGLDDAGDDAQLALQAGEWISFWSEALGGNVDYVNGDTEMSIQKREYVSGEDLFAGAGNLSLYGVIDCLKADISEQDANSGDIYLNGGDAGDLQNPYEYVFQASDRTLYIDSGALARVGLVDGAAPDEGFSSWGMMTGPLVADAADLAALASPWDVWQLDEYYQYETGHNEWNQYRALQRNGAVVTFDPPLSFLYTHSTSNDANGSADHDGETVFLQYGGFGNLWGIPHVEDSSTGRWYPAFSIDSGVLLGPNGDEYVIKAIESELFLREDNDAASSALIDALDVAASLTPPNISEWTNPSDLAKPNVTSQPKVVAGEIQ